MEEDAQKELSITKKSKSSKPRFRTKKLLNRVQEQLDFYFSDANLNHDRFLRKEIESSDDGYVDLSTMLKFNKLKQLTSDETILAKSVGNSLLLELSEDRQKVRRKTKLRVLENTDSRTVYVEEFPITADHDWLKSVFSTCGTVEYISLPRFKYNNQVKGFAFVEFSTTEEAQKACQVLNTIKSKNRKRSTDCKSEDESTKKKNNRKKRSNSECENQNITQLNIKRRRSVSESSDVSSRKLGRRRSRSSLSSTEEVSEGTADGEKIINKRSNVSGMPTKKKRSKERTTLTDEENIPSEIPLEIPSGIPSEIPLEIPSEIPSISVKQESNLNVTDPDIPSDVKPTTSPRKRKCSEIKENETKTDSQKDKKLKSLDSDYESCISSVKDSECKTNNGSFPKSNQKSSSNIDRSAIDSKDGTEKYQRKRKVSNTSDDEGVTSPCKKINIGNEEGKGVQKNAEITELKDDEMSKKKKNRQHKKKGEKVSLNIVQPPLHVIQKSEWLVLKKEYKNLQRIKMSELKRNLKVLKSEKVRRTELKDRITQTLTAKNKSVESTKGKKSTDDGDEEKENLLEPQRKMESMSSCLEKPAELKETAKYNDIKGKGLNVTSGTVVALKTSAESLTRKDIKSTLSDYGQVAYVDYVDGVFQGFVRFATIEDVEKVMMVSSEEKQAWLFQLKKLSSDEENEYFKKAEEDRQKKYDKDQKKKRKKGRGADRIVQDVEEVSNHIHFT